MWYKSVFENISHDCFISIKLILSLGWCVLLQRTSCCHLRISTHDCVVYSIVRLHWYSCPDLLAFCARMRSSCSLLYSCLFSLSLSLSLILQLQVQSQFPASCVSVFVPRTYTNTGDEDGITFMQAYAKL